MATLQRYRLGPMPAVAVMPVSRSTSRTRRIARSWAEVLYMRRYCVASMNTSSMLYTWMSSGAMKRR